MTDNATDRPNAGKGSKVPREGPRPNRDVAADKLYQQLSLDRVVDETLKDFSRSLCGLDRLLDRIFGPYDVLGRARAVARRSALTGYDTRGQEIGTETELLKSQVKTLEGERDFAKKSYDSLIHRVVRLVERGRGPGNLAQLAPDGRPQPEGPRDGPDRPGSEYPVGPDLEKTVFANDMARLRMNYEELRSAIRTLAGTIPYSEIREISVRALREAILGDNKASKLRTPDGGLDEEIGRYLGLAAEKGAEEAGRYSEESLGRILQDGIDKVSTEATLYTGTEVIWGSVYHLKEERLSDMLNDESAPGSWVHRPFLELLNVKVIHSDGQAETLPTAHVSKTMVRMAVLASADGARGIGAGAGQKPFPFVPKSTAQVELRTAEHILIGNVHCAPGQNARDVLNQPSKFLPLTDVAVRPLKDQPEFVAPFVAIDKKQILPMRVGELSSGPSHVMEEYYRKLLSNTLGFN